MASFIFLLAYSRYPKKRHNNITITIPAPTMTPIISLIDSSEEVLASSISCAWSVSDAWSFSVYVSSFVGPSFFVSFKSVSVVSFVEKLLFKIHFFLKREFFLFMPVSVLYMLDQMIMNKYF